MENFKSVKQCNCCVFAKAIVYYYARTHLFMCTIIYKNSYKPVNLWHCSCNVIPVSPWKPCMRTVLAV